MKCRECGVELPGHKKGCSRKPHYHTGDLVEVFDGDFHEWVPSVVEESDNRVLVAKTKDKVYEGLPLVYAVPWSAVPNLVRKPGGDAT